MPFFQRARNDRPYRRNQPKPIAPQQTAQAPLARLTGEGTGARVKPLIVHVIPWCMTVGGAQAFVVDLAAFALSRGSDVHLVHMGEAKWDWIEKPEGLTCHPATGPDNARRIVEKLHPDLVHQHYPLTSWGVKGIENRFPIVGTPHNWPQNTDPNLPAWAVPIAGPMACIRHGVDLELFSPHPQPLSRQTGEGGRRPGEGLLTVGIAGRMHFDKLPESFLDALDGWKPKNIRIRVAGRGLDHGVAGRIEKRLAALPFVDILGDLPRSAMPEFYRSLDVLLVPSIEESVCIAAIEAMACGVFVLGRHGGGLRDTTGPWGGWFGDTDADLLRCLDLMAKKHDPLWRDVHESNCRARAEAQFDRNQMFDAYARLYRDRTGGRVDLKSPRAVPALRDGSDIPGAQTSPSAPKIAGGDTRAPGERRSPQVSVLMPVYDGVEPVWLDEAIRSVLHQKGVDFQFVIVLDGPTDQRLIDMAHRYADVNGKITVVPIDHAGCAGALNAGLPHCRAELVARFDADDVMPAGRLAQQVGIMTANPAVDLLCGDMEILHPNGRVTLSKRPAYDPATPLWESWEKNWNICHPTVCFRKSRIVDLGGYDVSVAVAQDLDLWCRMQLAGHVIMKTSAVWNRYRIHPGQQTAIHRATMREETKGVLDRYRAVAAQTSDDRAVPQGGTSERAASDLTAEGAEVGR